jgi:hypothetical protein
MSNGDVITEIKNAIVAYPTNNVVITIESFERIAPAGGALNPPDKFRFKVKVVNKGCLDIVRAKALVKGTDYASVSLTKDLDTSFSSKVESTATFNVGGEGEYTTGYFYGRRRRKLTAPRLS